MKVITALLLLLVFLSCKKEEDNTVSIEYRLQTSSLTGDHFFVSYVTETGDTITNHEHPGWTYSFSTKKPFNAYVKARVNPIDTYVFTISLLIDGKVVQQDSASTASGAIQEISISRVAE